MVSVLKTYIYTYIMKENKTKNKGTLDDNLLITLNITSIKDYKASLEFFVTNILYL